jgi:hypothetical protein
MGNEGSHRRILNRLRCSYIQFVLRRHRNVIGAADPVPLWERTALGVVVEGLAVSSTVYVPKKAIAGPTGVRGLVPSDFGRSAAIICQE